MTKNEFQRLARQLRTPEAVQRFIHSLAYNSEPNGPTQKSAMMTLKTKVAHCMEGALLCCAILEHHGYPPLLLSLESVDKLDHIVFLFRKKTRRGYRWGAIGKSRDQGLAGRSPIFRSIRDLAWSYVDPYVDQTGRVKAYQVIDISTVKYDWRYSTKNLWAFENYLIDYPHKKMRASDQRHKRVLKKTLLKQRLKQEKYWW